MVPCTLTAPNVLRRSRDSQGNKDSQGAVGVMRFLAGASSIIRQAL